MTIQEAIKSGKSLKRSGWAHWLIINNFGRFIYRYDDPVELTSHDILATDWEVRP